MAQIINMPRLSDTMEEGVVAKWLKKVGDKIAEGDILAEIETDKATMEFESFHSGTLLYIGIKEGESAPVDSLLAIIGKEGEDISGLLKGNTEKKEEPASEEEKTPEASSSPSPLPIPSGVEIVKMPRLSDTMEEGTVARWLKKVGDKVSEGDILAEIETDKATMEFESFYSGTLLHIGITEGQSAPVDAVLAIIGPKGAKVEDVLATLSAGANRSSTPPSPVKDAIKTEEKTLQTASISQTTSVSSGERILASPLAKKIAKEKGITLSAVKGTGENGRIIKRDVEQFVPSASKPAVTMPFVPAGEERFEDVKNSQMRKTIAKRLAESKFSAPHYYLTIEVAMDNAVATRKMINELPDTKISFNDIVVKACATALKEHPRVNTAWQGDATRYNYHVHIGVAVAVEDGLVVPVLRFTDEMSLTQIGAHIKDLAEKVRTKKLAPQDMEGSTFTVSNLGMFGIEEFTSIINQPNSAILSVGAIVEKPVVKNSQIAVGNTMKLTLACDHRTVDGATGAQFLQTLKKYLENPVALFAYNGI